MHAPPRHVFFIGPRKTGTTTIYDVMRAQDVRTPASIKETFFFEKSVIDLRDYQRQFNLDPTIPFVEVSPSYFPSEHARRHLRRHFPDAWIVITLRDPVKRALSAISHAERIGLINVAEVIVNGEFETNKHIHNILSTSHFENYVDAWAQDFPRRTIVACQNAKGAFDHETIEQTARTCGIRLPAASMLSTRSNAARRPLSPGLVRRGKMVMRILDRSGLGAVRPYLKLLAVPIYRPAPQPDRALEVFLENRLEESRAYFRAQPAWTLR